MKVVSLVRDKSTINLIDGTHSITMSSTSSGYYIGQHTDTNITSHSNDKVLHYSSASKNGLMELIQGLCRRVLMSQQVVQLWVK